MVRAERIVNTRKLSCKEQSCLEIEELDREKRNF